MIKTTHLMVGSTVAMAGLITVLTLNIGATPEHPNSNLSGLKETPQSVPRQTPVSEPAHEPVHSSDAFLSNSMGNHHVEATHKP